VQLQAFPVRRRLSWLMFSVTFLSCEETFMVYLKKNEHSLLPQITKPATKTISCQSRRPSTNTITAFSGSAPRHPSKRNFSCTKCQVYVSCAGMALFKKGRGRARCPSSASWLVDSYSVRHWRWRQHSPPKIWCSFVTLHGIAIPKTTIESATVWLDVIMSWSW
jgi:hypothetical protein